jgi:hypothetical protein
MPAANHPLLVSPPLIEPAVTRKIGLIRRRKRTLTPAAQLLYDLFDDGKKTRARSCIPPERGMPGARGTWCPVRA